MKRSLFGCLVAVLALGACTKKADGPNAAAALTTAGSGKYLPPGASMYVDLDAKAVLASAAIAPYKEQLKATFPEPCRGLVDVVEHVSLAAYGEGLDGLPLLPRKVERREDESTEPEAEMKMVAVLTGPPAAAVRSCLEAVAQEGGFTPTSSQQGGREVLVVGKAGELRFFSASDTVHVVTSVSLLEPALAAAGGGPGLDGSPALQALDRVPAGQLVVGMAFPPELVEEMSKGLALFAQGKTIPAPTALAVSAEVSSSLVLNGALLFADDAGAQAILDIARSALSMAKMGVSMAASEDPTAAQIKQVLDGLALGRTGSAMTVRAAVSVDLIYKTLIESKSRPGRRRHSEP